MLRRPPLTTRPVTLFPYMSLVLSFAMKLLDGPKETLDFPDLQAGVEPLVLMVFMDPPREEAVAALAECRSAGVMVKMITGDHAATALAIDRKSTRLNSSH